MTDADRHYRDPRGEMEQRSRIDWSRYRLQTDDELEQERRFVAEHECRGLYGIAMRDYVILRRNGHPPHEARSKAALAHRFDLPDTEPPTPTQSEMERHVELLRKGLGMIGSAAPRIREQAESIVAKREIELESKEGWNA